MAGPEWSDDPDTPELNANLAKVYPDVLAHAFGIDQPSAELVKSWHEGMHDGVVPPSPSYVGRFRGDSHTDLLDYEVRVGGLPGVRSYLVYGEVDRLLAWLQADLAALATAVLSPIDRDERVLEIAARMHGEWIRIHPFVNGNGRTARLWVLWILARHRMPALLRIRPRPAPPYGTSAYASMTGDHTHFFTYLRQLYAAHVAKGTNSPPSP